MPCPYQPTGQRSAALAIAAGLGATGDADPVEAGSAFAVATAGATLAATRTALLVLVALGAGWGAVAKGRVRHLLHRGAQRHPHQSRQDRPSHPPPRLRCCRHLLAQFAQRLSIHLILLSRH